MRHARIAGLIALGGLFLMGPSEVSATNGHFLHGVGAVNAAMGGTGVAGAKDVLGAMNLNPAGLMAFRGNRVDLGFELFQADRTLSSDAGPFGAGSTRSKKSYVPVPAFGWSSMLEGGKVVLALGGLGIGGFGVDYPASTSNPILAPRPFGFGQVYSNFQLMKIAPSIAFAASDKLWLGASLNVDWASLAVDPMPAASPDVNPADGSAFYPSATAADGAFGFGFQAGFIYHVNDLLAVGGSYSSTQWFQDFEFNAMHANPSLQNFGTPREITFALDVPAIVSGGVSLQALPNLTINGDARYIFYENTNGFDKSGFDATGAVQGFGWENILVLAVGGELLAGERVALRAGYNHNDNPIPDGLSFFNVAAPAIVTDHITFGIGVKVNRRFAINAGYYHVFQGKIDGPMYGPQGPMQGTSVKTVMTENSFQVEFSIGSRGEIF
jgi:long-chain fatty acid transport protein